MSLKSFLLEWLFQHQKARGFRPDFIHPDEVRKDNSDFPEILGEPKQEKKEDKPE